MSSPRPMTTKTPTRLSAGTIVEADKTKAEIEKYLRSRDVRPPIVLTEDPDNNRIVLLFKLFGRNIRMSQGLPDLESKFINRAFGARAATFKDIESRMKSEERRKWRVLFLRVKLRLDLIFDEQDLEEREDMFHHEFLADTFLESGGTTVAEWAEPQVEAAYKTGRPIQLLPQPAPFKQLSEDK